jgi:hypothetical protein
MHTPLDPGQRIHRLGLIAERRTTLFRSSVLALLVFAFIGANADAHRTWCRTDPVVAIGGAVADVFVAGPLAAPLYVTGPTQVVVTVPVGVDAWLVLSDLGFGRGEVVGFAQSAALQVTDDGIEVQVQVYVPADRAMPVLVEFAPRLIGILWPDSAEGTANSWITLGTVL